jgi:hypothetical protein
LTPTPPAMITETHIDLFQAVPDDVIAALVEATPPVAGVELRHWGGAMARPQDGAGPIGHRDVPFSVNAIAQVPDPAQAGAAAAAVERFAARLRPHATGGTFLNFLLDPARTATAYTADDYARLAAVKATYDPDNFFAANHNIPPAA